MSKLEDLMKELCPEGVEYKKLKDVANFLYGYPFEANLFTEDENYYPLIRIRDVKPGYTKTYYKGEILTDYIIHRGDILVGMDGEFNLAKWKSVNALLNQRVCKIYSKGDQVILNGFLYHLLLPMFKEIESNMQGSTVKHLSAQKLNSISIPVPPLPVQEEIVHILDTFTELQAELQAELQKRLQQYNYYRDKLLSFKEIGGENEVRWMKLGEIATEMYRGAGIKRDEVTKYGTPCIRYGEIHTTYNIWFDQCVSHTNESLQPSKKYADYGDILFAITSEDIDGIGNCVAYVGKEKIMVGGDIVVMKHSQNPKYLAYALSTTNAVKQKGKGKVKSKVVHTSVPGLQEIIIPLPSLEEQERIANVLDRFDALCTDLTSGLPAEIEGRRKQYEYYRDKLLSFTPLSFNFRKCESTLLSRPERSR